MADGGLVCLLVQIIFKEHVSTCTKDNVLYTNFQLHGLNGYGVIVVTVTDLAPSYRQNLTKFGMSECPGVYGYQFSEAWTLRSSGIGQFIKMGIA